MVIVLVMIASISTCHVFKSCWCYILAQFLKSCHTVILSLVFEVPSVDKIHLSVVYISVSWNTASVTESFSVQCTSACVITG